MKQVKVKAYAKVNLILNVLGKRPDGYHEIESFMQAIGLCDEVWIANEEMPQGRLFVALDPGREDLPKGEDNLAYKAAILMHETYHPGRGERIKIVINKRIPVAAGLAGGSADGAAVIKGLAKLWDIAPGPELYALAARLGSDVPFCLAAQNGRPAAIATGRGTELRFVKPVDCTISVHTPNIRLSSAEVYANLREEDCKDRADIEAFMAAESLEEKAAIMRNHLQAPAQRLKPQLEQERRILAAQPGVICAIQSGSGPSIICIKEKRASRQQAVSDYALRESFPMSIMDQF